MVGYHQEGGETMSELVKLADVEDMYERSKQAVDLLHDIEAWADDVGYNKVVEDIAHALYRMSDLQAKLRTIYRRLKGS
jgi:hypothetical protein